MSADADFAAILATSGAPSPSVILFRHGAEHRPALQVRLLLDNLPDLAESLDDGALATIEPSRVRVRRLPI